MLDKYKFIDNGYSGSHLIRPGLEQLRDKVAAGEIGKVYMYSPDRLSRKYAYQMVLLEEFQKAGTEVSFLNCQTNDNPESQLLLQMQGMIAEYERAKIMERNRRGKIHAAKKGAVSVMAQAPFGYLYIDKYTGGGQAFFEIHEKEAEIVRKIFFWIGQERLSIGQVHRQLNEIYPFTRKGLTNTDSYRFAGKKLCSNTQLRMEMLDIAVWDEVQNLLKNPSCLLNEYERRSSELENSSLDHTSNSLDNQINRLKRGISKLIDSYTQEYIDQSEFEPGIKEMKQRLKLLENEHEKIIDQIKLKKELRLIINRLENFSSSVNAKLANIDWIVNIP